MPALRLYTSELVCFYFTHWQGGEQRQHGNITDEIHHTRTGFIVDERTDKKERTLCMYSKRELEWTRETHRNEREKTDWKSSTDGLSNSFLRSASWYRHFTIIRLCGFDCIGLMRTLLEIVGWCHLPWTDVLGTWFSFDSLLVDTNADDIRFGNIKHWFKKNTLLGNRKYTIDNDGAMLDDEQVWSEGHVHRFVVERLFLRSIEGHHR